MCTISMVGDFYKDRWQPYAPNLTPGTTFTFLSLVTREEFEKLKAEVAEMADLLKKAKEIDDKTGQPDCQNEEKLKVLRAVAKAVMGEDYELPV